MTVLLHLSDTHFGTEEAPVVAAVQKLVRSQRPSAVILSGDITQRARRAQFEAARAFCDSLHVDHLLTLPGNHDIPLYNIFARIFFPYGNYMRAFGDALEPIMFAVRHHRAPGATWTEGEILNRRNCKNRRNCQNVVP